ncbi:hydrolase [Bacteriovorax stolpii]|uniref:isochorismatase family protein n=1 Tax=Bacteriovorax stolpii TaxID=960 RepID=UPI001158DD54|nr:isochorismatase family protein [Bacteriovorax stolpii]QDK40461.1 hydrolase [Bacteriovorax stolpii]
MMKSPKGVWDADDCALILIDYQPEMFSGLGSAYPKEIELNVCTIAKAAVAFNIPIILSTVAVRMGVNKPTIQSLRDILQGVVEIDRTSMDAWEDKAFVDAVKATGKKRLVFCALYTEICLTYPVVDAIADGFEVCFVADAVAGQSLIEHNTAISRLIAAGAVPNTTSAMIGEWFRDWSSPLASDGREILISYYEKKANFHINEYHSSSKGEVFKEAH